LLAAGCFLFLLQRSQFRPSLVTSLTENSKNNAGRFVVSKRKSKTHKKGGIRKERVGTTPEMVHL